MSIERVQAEANINLIETIPEKVLVTVVFNDEDLSLKKRYDEGILSNINPDSLTFVPSQEELRDKYSTLEGPIIVRPENPMRPNRIIATMTEDKNGVERYDFRKVKNITAPEIIKFMEEKIDLSISKEAAQLITKVEFLNNKDTLILQDKESKKIVVLSEQTILDMVREMTNKNYSLEELNQLFIDKSLINQIKDEPEHNVFFVNFESDPTKDKFDYLRLRYKHYYDRKDIGYIDGKCFKKFNILNGKTDTTIINNKAAKCLILPFIFTPKLGIPVDPPILDVYER